MCKRVYVSYRWQEPIEGITRNWLVPSINATGFRCVIDVKDCAYKGRIDKFEEEIGSAERIVIMLSQQFYYSDQCMYEAALITKNDNLDRRLFPVNIGDYQHNNAFYHRLLEHWDEEERIVSEYLKTHDYGVEPFQEKKNRLNLIKENIGKFWSHISNENFLNFSAVSENNFNMIRDLFGGVTQVAGFTPVTEKDV